MGLRKFRFIVFWNLVNFVQGTQSGYTFFLLDDVQIRYAAYKWFEINITKHFLNEFTEISLCFGT